MIQINIVRKNLFCFCRCRIKLHLYNNYAPTLYQVIYHIIEDVSPSEDVLQEVFVKIWNNFSTYDKVRGRLFTWMIALTKNLAIDMLRSKDFKKQRKIFGDEHSINYLPDHSMNTNKFDSLGIRKHVAHLKPDQKIIIDLAYFNGYTQAEIAKDLKMPLGTVKTKMREATLKLKKII